MRNPEKIYINTPWAFLLLLLVNCTGSDVLEKKDYIEFEMWINLYQEYVHADISQPIQLGIRLKNNSDKKIFIDQILPFSGNIRIMKQLPDGTYEDYGTDYMENILANTDSVIQRLLINHVEDFFFVPKRWEDDTYQYPASFELLFQEVASEMSKCTEKYPIGVDVEGLRHHVDFIYRLRLYLDPNASYEDTVNLSSLFIEKGTYKIYFEYPSTFRIKGLEEVHSTTIEEYVKHGLPLTDLDNGYASWRYPFVSDPIVIVIQ